MQSQPWRNIDEAESDAIRDYVSGVVGKESNWVWVARGEHGYTFRVAYTGALELWRRVRKERLEKGEPLPLMRLAYCQPSHLSTTSSISVIVQLRDPLTKENFLGGQDDVLYRRVQREGGEQEASADEGTEVETMKEHGTARALHKAIRNTILNYLLVTKGEEYIIEFVDEAIRMGKAATRVRGKTVIFRPEYLRQTEQQQVTSRQQAEPRPQAQAPQAQAVTRVQTTPQAGQDHRQWAVNNLLSSGITSEQIDAFLLLYMEVVERDPDAFSSATWQDFVNWCNGRIGREEVNELVSLGKKVGEALGENVSDNREIFRFLSREKRKLPTITTERLTELRYPEYLILKNHIASLQYLSTDKESDEDFPF